MPNPDGRDGKDNEYFIIYNSSDVQQNLDEWKVCNIRGNCFILSNVIEGKGCLKIFRNEFNFVLHNDQEKLILFDKEQNIINEITTKSAPSGKAWICLSGNCEWLEPKESCDYDQNEEPLPVNDPEGEENNGEKEEDVEEPVVLDENQESPYMEKVIISEIFPAPAGGGEEWIELENVSLDNINLSSWTLDDMEAGSKQCKLDTNITPLSFLVLKKSQTKIGFNNDGDEVRLFDEKGLLVDKVTYSKTYSDKSYVLKDGEWDWSDTATPGLENVLEKPEVSSSSESTFKVRSRHDLKKARKILRRKTSIQADIQGRVVISPGITGKTTFHIRANKGVMKVQFYSSYEGSKKAVKEGRVVKIKNGYLRRRNRGWFVGLGKKSKVEILKKRKGKDPEEFLPDSAEKQLGKIVKIKGEIESKKGYYFFIKGLPRVYVPKVVWEKYRKKLEGKTVRYKGGGLETIAVLDKVDRDYRLVVREAEDLNLKLPKKKKKVFKKNAKPVKKASEKVVHKEEKKINDRIVSELEWKDIWKISLIKTRGSIKKWFGV